MTLPASKRKERIYLFGKYFRLFVCLTDLLLTDNNEYFLYFCIT